MCRFRGATFLTIGSDIFQNNSQKYSRDNNPVKARAHLSLVC